MNSLVVLISIFIGFTVTFLFGFYGFQNVFGNPFVGRIPLRNKTIVIVAFDENHEWIQLHMGTRIVKADFVSIITNGAGAEWVILLPIMHWIPFELVPKYDFNTIDNGTLFVVRLNTYMTYCQGFDCKINPRVTIGSYY